MKAPSKLILAVFTITFTLVALLLLDYRITSIYANKFVSDLFQKDQVLAKVGDGKITVASFMRKVARSPARFSYSLEYRKRMLQTLIDREILIQEAIANGIDKDFEVVLTIEEANKQIISQAMLGKIISDSKRTGLEVSTKIADLHKKYSIKIDENLFKSLPLGD